jgi:hypothetical protein
MSIKVCQNCGGLFATENAECFGGRACQCGSRTPTSQPAGAGQPSPEALSLAKDINALPGNEIIPAAAKYRFAAKEIDAYTATLRAELEAAKAECVALRACLTEACDVVDGVREGDTVDSFTAQPWRLALSRIPECYSHLVCVDRQALRKAVEALTANANLYPDLHQLLTGWHCDVAWSEWDTHVFDQMILDQQKVEAALAALKGQP